MTIIHTPTFFTDEAGLAQAIVRLHEAYQAVPRDDEDQPVSGWDVEDALRGWFQSLGVDPDGPPLADWQAPLVTTKEDLRETAADAYLTPVCPWPDCGAEDQLLEVDDSRRANEVAVAAGADRDLRLEDGAFVYGNAGDVSAEVSLADSDHQHVGWLCRACRRPVRLPERWHEEY